jgi:hypothetical protein
MADEQKQREKQFLKAWDEFWKSPAGAARQAFGAGEVAFQCVLNNASDVSRATDLNAFLNAVCREGWEPISAVPSYRGSWGTGGRGGFSRTDIYYLFKRCEANRVSATEEDLRQRIWEPIALRSALRETKGSPG